MWVKMPLIPCPTMPETKPKLHISVITLFPDIFVNHLQHLPLSRAISKNLVQVRFINLRDFATDKRGTVDSAPYGGGPGMILRPEPIFDAITFALESHPGLEDRSEGTTTQNGVRTIFLTPRGKTYNQNKALELSKVDNLIIVCGRYEGIDQRVIKYFTGAEEISIGKYVLSGGEVPAMAVMESVIRLIPGAIDNTQALENESFNPSRPNSVEHPQYSRPEDWRGIKVPDILLSGHHANINKWKGI